MRSALLGMAAVTLVIAVAGCRDSLEPRTPENLLVSRIDAPASIAAGTPLSVTLTVNVGCNRIERFEISRNASGADITIWGGVLGIGRRTRCRMPYVQIGETDSYVRPTVRIDIYSVG